MPDRPDELHETTARLGTERLSKLLLRLSAPSIVSAVTISLYHLADTFWLGQLSYQAIAAVTITFPFYIAVISIGVGTGVGANALASRRFGERNIEATNQVAGQIFPLTAVFGVIFTVVSVFFARPVAILLGATPDIAAMTTDYLVFLGWGMPFILFRLLSRNVFHAAGDAVKPMIFTVVGAVLNAALDPFFIFGWLPIVYFSRVRSIPEYFERRFNRTARYLAVVIILKSIFSLKTFDQVFMLTNGGPGTATQTLSHYIYFNGMKYGQIGYAASVAWLMVIPMIILTYFYAKFVFRKN